MKATLTIIIIPSNNPKPDITDEQVILEQLPPLVRRMEYGLTNASDSEWVNHTVRGLINQRKQPNPWIFPTIGNA